MLHCVNSKHYFLKFVYDIMSRSSTDQQDNKCQTVTCNVGQVQIFAIQTQLYTAGVFDEELKPLTGQTWAVKSVSLV